MRFRFRTSCRTRWLSIQRVLEMEQDREPEDLMELHCTLGRGMEVFCLEELGVLGARIRSTQTGKFCFALPSNVRPHLRTAERIFVTAYHGLHNFNVSDLELAKFQLQRFITEEIPWEKSLADWKRYLRKPIAEGPIPFRVNLRLGESWKKLNTVKLALSIAQRLSHLDSVPLTTSIRKPVLLIDIHVKDAQLSVGLALYGFGSSARGGPLHGLRSTIAYAMVLCLGVINPNSVILDPMCGKGSLLFELPHCKNVIGVDISDHQLRIAKLNVPQGDLILADAQKLPLKDSFVDYIICDLPFGIQYCSPSELATLIPAVIAEMKRVCKSGAKIVLLMSRDHDRLLQNSVGRDWILIRYHEISIGCIGAVINVYISN